VSNWQARVDALWARFDATDADAFVSEMAALADEHADGDGRAAFELAGAHDSVGDEQAAERRYEEALALGLPPEQHAQLAVQYGSTLRNTGRLDDAIAVLSAAPTHPSTGSAPRAFLALALHAAGRPDEALRVALEALEPTLPRYNRSLRAYAAALTEPTEPPAA
jgi:tetratricopeptide (TPR) repeat protein